MEEPPWANCGPLAKERSHKMAELNEATEEVVEQTNEVDTEGVAEPTEIDWKAQARKHERRTKEAMAKAKANEEAAQKLADIEAANMSDLERAQERIAQLEAELGSTKETALRTSIISEFGLDPEDAEVLLTAKDEEGLRAQAERLASKGNEKPKPSLSVNNSDIEGTPSTNSRTALAKAIFG
ncbi:hypothetical protein [Glutamicibacter sp. TV12E]|uniref:hypothetical protein n=1 Tax=Glutamicibacter sp. TV12E TaxID=3446362 RepID=UPI0040331E72